MKTKRIKEITIAKGFKKSQNYNSVQSFISVTIEKPTDKEIEDAKLWVHNQAENECDNDPSWMRQPEQKSMFNKKEVVK